MLDQPQAWRLVGLDDKYQPVVRKKAGLVSLGG